MRYTKLMLTMISLTAGTLPLTLQAQEVPGPHPAYIHALTNLRAARHYLADNWAWAPVKHDDDAAIQAIDAAISEIKMAALDDGKTRNDAVPINTSLSPHDRFRKADELLFGAHNDLARAEDVPQARGLRNRALADVDKAHDIVKNAESIARWQ